FVDRAAIDEQQRHARIVAALEAIRQAEQRHHAEHGSYTDLDTLTGAGLLDPAHFDEARTAGVRSIGSSLVTVLLPHEPDSPHFAAVAWPSEARIGEVFACDDQRSTHGNSLVAARSGIERPATTDLFVSGEFGGAWTPGWRAMNADTTAA